MGLGSGSRRAGPCAASLTCPSRSSWAPPSPMPAAMACSRSLASPARMISMRLNSDAVRPRRRSASIARAARRARSRRHGGREDDPGSRPLEIAPSTSPDLAAELDAITDADALLRWALDALPRRNRLSDEERAELDAAFLARAEALAPSRTCSSRRAGRGARASARAAVPPRSLTGGSTMLRPKRLPRCEGALPRRSRPRLLRQDGRCADCGTRLIMGFFVFDHRPPLALRAEDADANDPERLAAICWTCDQQKTPRDLKEIARSKRIARKHQDVPRAPAREAARTALPLA